MDRLKALESYTDDELLAEIQRRRLEAQQRLSRLSLASDDGRSILKSQAKAAYWSSWHQYKAQHPDATVDVWRKAQKRGKR